jgi:hypothetical protein
MSDTTRKKFDIVFIPSGRGKARCPSNPDHPHGIDIDCSQGKIACTIELPYPSPECGIQRVTCLDCGFKAVCTVAGRPDDPRTITIPCKDQP